MLKPREQCCLELTVTADAWPCRITWYQRDRFPGGPDSKESACNSRDLGFISGSGRSSGEMNSYSLQYPCLKNTMDRGAWRATVHGVAKSQSQLNN